MEIPTPPDEALRLDALHRYAILDTPPDPAFDRITRLAARLLRAPIALISFVDKDRQWFKSAVGIDIEGTARAAAFCAHTIAGDGPFVVPDAAADPAFSASPLVRTPYHVRYYAGIPLKSRGGFNLGALSVMDTRPRALSDEEIALLTDLAALAADELELRLALIDLQRSEQDRQHSDSLRESVFSAAELGICITSEDGIFVDVNPAYCRIFGYTREQLIGRHFSLVLQPKDMRRARIVHNAFFKRGRAAEGEWEATRQDGATVSVYLTGKRFHDREGRAFAVTTVTDLTALKRMERELGDARKMDAIGRLAGGVAHDFNNLLTVILGYAHVGLDLARGEPVHAAIEEILKAAEKAAAMTRQLLACSRQQPFETQLLDLNAVVSSLEDVLHGIVSEQIELHIEKQTPVPLVRADRRQLEQAILNLAVNARDAMPGGGSLVIRTGAEDVGPERHLGRKTPPGRYATIAVSDTGIGMNDEVQRHLFEPFFTTKESGKTAGFGLPTVYGIVRRFGGAITVESRAGRGSTFRIYLPEAAGRKLPASETALHQARTALSILLVEGDEPLRKMLATMLAGRGHAITAVPTAAEAISAGSERAFDLLIADAHLPDGSGVQLAAGLSSVRSVGRALLISSAERADLPKIPGLSAEWLRKPFSVDQLDDCIARMFREDAA